MASSAADAAIEEELEALAALYPDNGLRVTRGGVVSGEDASSSVASPTRVSLDVAPRTLDDATQQYVRATLTIILDNEYPAGAPTLHLGDARGLDDARQAEVMRRLREATADFAAPGDPVLALLCETAFETLTDLNHPDGDCAFCLTPVAGDPNDPAAPFMKLMRCYHCFHTACFRDWWRWKTAAAEADDRARGPRHPVGSEEAARAPTHLCPVCRVPIEEEDVRHVRLEDEDETQANAIRGEASRFEPGERLTRDEVAALRSQRARFEEAMRRQRSKGGLIEEGDGEGIALAPGVRASDFGLPTPAPTPSPRPPPPKPGGKPKGGGGRGGGGLGWLKKAAASAANGADAIERGMRDVRVGDEDGGSGGGGGRGRGGRSRGRGRGGRAGGGGGGGGGGNGPPPPQRQ